MKNLVFLQVREIDLIFRRKVSKLPQHKVSNLLEMGIYLRRFLPGVSQDTPVTYTHQDDYYMFGFVEAGEYEICIDFKTYQITAGTVMMTQPGQVYELLNSSDLSAYVLFVDSTFVEEIQKRVFGQYILSSQTVMLPVSLRRDME